MMGEVSGDLALKISGIDMATLSITALEIQSVLNWPKIDKSFIGSAL